MAFNSESDYIKPNQPCTEWSRHKWLFVQEVDDADGEKREEQKCKFCSKLRLAPKRDKAEDEE